jgi:inner membrane protein
MSLELAFVILGVVLLVLEMTAPGFFLLFIGAAALITGGVFMLIPVAWQTETIVFALLSCLFVYIALRFGFYKTPEHPTLNNRVIALIGQIYPLHTAIVNGRGVIKVGDSLWAVEGFDLPVGTQVRVMSHIGDLLTVEAV